MSIDHASEAGLEKGGEMKWIGFEVVKEIDIWKNFAQWTGKLTAGQTRRRSIG